MIENGLWRRVRGAPIVELERDGFVVRRLALMRRGRVRSGPQVPGVMLPTSAIRGSSPLSRCAAHHDARKANRQDV